MIYTWRKRSDGYKCNQCSLYVFEAEDGSFCTYVISVVGDKCSEFDFPTAADAMLAAVACYEALSA